MASVFTWKTDEEMLLLNASSLTLEMVMLTLSFVGGVCIIHLSCTKEIVDIEDEVSVDLVVGEVVEDCVVVDVDVAVVVEVDFVVVEVEVAVVVEVDFVVVDDFVVCVVVEDFVVCVVVEDLVV